MSRAGKAPLCPKPRFGTSGSLLRRAATSATTGTEGERAMGSRRTRDPGQGDPPGPPPGAPAGRRPPPASWGRCGACRARRRRLAGNAARGDRVPSSRRSSPMPPPSGARQPAVVASMWCYCKTDDDRPLPLATVRLAMMTMKVICES